MKVDAKRLAMHIAKLPVKEALFTGKWECNALNADKTTLTIAPPLEDFEPLPQPIGISTRVLIRALEQFGGTARRPRTIEMTVADGRLIIKPSGKDGPTLYLMLIDEQQVQSRVEPEEVQKVLDSCDGYEDQPFDVLPIDEALQGVIDTEEDPGPPKVPVRPEEITKIARYLQIDRIALHVGPKGGSWQLVAERGVEEGIQHSATYIMIAHHYLAPSSYGFAYHTRTLRPFFRAMIGAQELMIRLTGEDGVVMFSDADGWYWIVSPIEARRRLVRRKPKAEKARDP